MLEGHFGRYGVRLYELARGIDHNPVVPNRTSKSLSAEDTFERDIPLAETEPLIRKLAAKVWSGSRENARQARTIVLKLKTKEFNTLTRSLTPQAMPTSEEEFANLAVSLCDRVDLDAAQLFRLVGVGLSNFQVESAHDLQLFGNGEDE
jgi:DNA polymerase-4